ncbi:MAG: hypothetical protein MJ229_02550 [bacterium]|nr:hypothetical protein [bacterium]
MVNFPDNNFNNSIKPFQQGTAINGAKNIQPTQNAPLNQLAKNIAPQPKHIFNNFNYPALNTLRMNEMANTKRSLYLKEIMNLPKDMEQVLTMLQKTSSETATKQLSELLNSNIKLSTLAKIMQDGGKEAMTKLISAMAEASRNGISDLSQIKDAMKFLNASTSATGQESQTQALKNFMLLYLPWLPLQEGVDFELEIENKKEEGNEDETVLTILISTRNYGNIKILIVTKGINDFDILINCVENFPQKILLQKIKDEEKTHSIQTNIDFEKKEEKHTESTSPKPQAKVTMSNLTEVNPYLLLLANAIIRYTIEIDNLVEN